MRGAEDRAWATERDAEPGERGRVLALVAENVRLRFGLDAESFADHLLDRARAAAHPPDQPAHERVRRLSLDDLYLARACARSDEAAWTELARRYFAFIRDFARRFLPEPDAADLADQVIADLWQAGKLARYEGRSTLRTWLGAVVAHAALNSGKAARRRVPLEGEELRSLQQRQGSAGEPAAATEARSLLGRVVTSAIGALPPEEKLLVLLHYEQGLTLEEMAIALRSSKTALSRRLKRTRERLRAAIESLAHRWVGVSAGSLREGVDLACIELDLEGLVGPSQHLERQHGALV